MDEGRPAAGLERGDESPAEDSGKLSLAKRLSRFGHRLCVKHDLLSMQNVRGKTDDIRRYYDFLAPVYDLIYPRSTSYLDSARYLVNRFVKPGDRILDLGSGTGLVTMNVLSKALSVISFDLHESMLRRARKKVHRHRRKSGFNCAGTAYCQGNATVLPFASHTFDLVASAFMLVYLDTNQKKAALAEARRVLRMDGRLALLTFQGEIHPRFTTRDAWREILSEAGFTSPCFEDFNEVFRTISATPVN